MRLSQITRAAEVTSVQKATSKAISFGKAWDPGDQLLVLLPVRRVVEINEYSGREEVVYEPVLASVFGHRIQKDTIKGIGSFVPSLVDYDSDYRPIRPAKGPDNKPLFDDNGCILWERTEPDFLGRVAPIFRVLYNAVHEENLKKIAAENLSPKFKEAKQKEEDERFKNSSPALSRVKLYASTEVLAIKLLEGKIDTSNEQKPAFYSMEWKGKIASQISTLLRSPQTKPDFEDDFGFIALTFNYPKNSEKSKSGQELSIQLNVGEKSAEALSPAEWVEIKGMADSLPRTAEEIGRRAWAYQEQSEQKIRKAVYDYLGQYVIAFSAVDKESDDMKILVKRSAELIECVGEKYLSDNVKEAIKEAQESEEESDENPQELRTYEEAAPTAKDMMAAAEAEADNDDDDNIDLP